MVGANILKSWLVVLPVLAVVACGVPQNSIEVKTSREAAAASCEQTGKCVKDPSGLVLYNSDLVTETFILKTPAQNPTLLAKLMNLVDEPKLLSMSGKLDPLIRGVRLVSESELCDSPKGIDGINPTISQLRVFKQGRYKACISYIGDGLFKRVYALPSIEVDTTAPEIAKDAMTKSVLTAASASLSWSKSIDNLTPESKLVYSVYVSKTNALDSVDSVLTYGSLVPGLLVGGTSYILNSLDADTDYNVAVTVTDEAGNRSLVGHASFKTLPLDATVPTVTISSDRDPGPTNLTSVLLTIQFSEAVNAFTAAGINVNGATKGQFTAIDSDTYTLGLSTISSTVSAVVPAGSAKDAAGNNSLVSNTWSLAINGATAAPVAFPVPGVYTSAKSVELSSQTPGATIYYTLDDSTPTVGSLVYSMPIFVGVTTTIKALATAPMHNDSAVVSLPFTITGKVQTPSFSVASGSYGPAQAVEMSTATPGAAIYYTDDGSEPTRSSTRYLGAVNVTEPKTIKAFAVFADWADSAVETAQYTINGPVANPVGDPAPATYNSIQSVRLMTIPADAQIYFTTDGTDPSTSASRSLYSGAITVGASVIIKALATRVDYVDSEVVTFEYNILPAVTFTPDSITLTAGVASGSITPSRTDVPIESCSITPSLPQGLDFNTSDCSISGTPAYGGRAATYAVTPANAGGVGNAATITIAVNGTDAIGAYYLNGELANGRVADPDPYADNNVLLMHFDGANSSANFADASISNRAVTRNGNVIISNEQSMFGGSSAYFDGSGSSLWIPAETAFDFNEDFTMEGWFYFSTTNQSNGASLLFSSDVDDNIQLNSELNSNTIRYFSDSWSSYLTATLSSSLASRWAHLAVVRQAGIITIYENGQAVASSYAPKQYDVGGLYIGQQNPFRSDHWFHGYMDEIRITKGLARYTSNFTPATSAFGDVCYTAGVKRACGRADYSCPATGYCSALAMYFINGVEHSGLNSAGTGISTVDNKYYVNGSLASGLVGETDPHGDKTVLLMHMDGDDNSTSFMDSSSSGFSPELVGAPRIRTTQSRFGGTSAYFNGTGDYGTSERLQFGPSTALALGTQDFTIEAWFYQTGTSQDIPMPIEIGGPHSNSDAFGMWLHANSWDTSGFSSWYSSPYSFVGPATSLNRWTHAAWVRKDGNLTIFIDGIAGASAPLPNNLGGSGLRIGGGAYQNYYNYEGYIDELRITKGLARYTSNFTPPTAAFGDTCFTAGEQRACTYVEFNCLATGYCSGLAMYHIEGFPHPGLNSSGTGTSSVDNKYYVNGALANGLVSDNSVLLLHMNGTEGSTSFKDSTTKALTGNVGGEAKITNAQSKFGNGSAYFDGSDDYISFTSQDDFVFGTGDFTAELWFMPQDQGSNEVHTLITTADPSDAQGFLLGTWYNFTLRYYVGDAADWIQNRMYAWYSIATGSWQHLAVSRKNGTTMTFLNGSLVDSFEDTNSYTNTNNAISIGGRSFINQSFVGWIDEVRVTKGTARYTTDFTPANEEFTAYQCFAAGVSRACNYQDFGCASDGFCAANSMYYSNGIEQREFTGFYNNACYAQGYNTGGVVNGTGYCIADEKYYLQGIEQPGLDVTGTGVNTNNGKYYVNGAIANGSYPGRAALLMHMDGADGSQSFVDSSPKALSITPMGNVAISQSRSKFGGSSAYFDGAGSYLQVNRSSHLAVGSRDFTIEVWANPTQLGVNDLAAVIDTRMNGGTTGLMLWLDSSSRKWVAYSSTNGNSQQFVMESLNVASLNSWTHLALSRTGDTFRFFVNGEIQDTQNWAFDFTQDSEARALIGTAADSPGGMRNFYGYIDEVQITVGQGLYTSNFTPASEESSPWQCFTDGVSRACTQQDWTNFNFSDQRSCALWGSSGQVIAGTVVFEALGLGSDEACFNTCKNIPEVKCITMYAVWAFGGGRCTCTSSPETYSYPGFYDMVTWTPQ